MEIKDFVELVLLAIFHAAAVIAIVAIVRVSLVTAYRESCKSTGKKTVRGAFKHDDTKRNVA